MFIFNQEKQMLVKSFGKDGVFSAKKVILFVRFLFNDSEEIFEICRRNYGRLYKLQ